LARCETRLLDHHRRLIEDSAISPEVAEARGYRSVTTRSEMKRLGFADRQCRVPALLIPVFDITGEIVNYQLRPDEPRASKQGRPIKYETVSGSRMALDVPPAARNRLGNPSVPLFITEGIRKADSAVSKGLCCIDVLGIWNWRGSNEEDGKVALPDWEYVALKGRKTYLCFDSDVMTKREVHQALVRLAAFLKRLGAEVLFVYLPPGPSGEKVGLDDYLAAGHEVEDLLSLASTELRKPLHDQEDARESRYFASGAGLVWRKPVGDNWTDVLLTNFDARIVSEVIEDDGAESRRLFEIEASLGNRSFRFAIPASQFAALNWPAEHLGAQAVVYPGFGLRDHARAAIQLLSENVSERHTYTHTGWREIDGRWVYLHAGGGIGQDGAVEFVEVCLPGPLVGYKLPEPPEGEELRNAIQNSLRLLELAPEAIVFPVFCSIWLSVFGVSDLSVHIAGPTGAGKTQLAALAQQHWGGGMDAQHLPGSWSSTSNATEALAFAAKDAVLVVDDFAPCGSGSDIARCHREADRLLRAQGNRSARQRLSSDASLRQAKPPRGLILSTGEDIPKGESLRARMVVIEIPPDALDWKLLSECQHHASSGQYARAMAGYLKWFSPRYDELQQEACRLVEEMRNSATVPPRHRRTPDNVAKLAVGLRVFLDFAADVEAVNREEADKLWQRGWTALRQVAEAQPSHQAASDPAGRFVELIRAALGSGLAHVASPEGQPPDRPGTWGWREDSRGSTDGVSTVWRPQGNRIGWVRAQDLYLEPEASYAIAQRVARDGGDAITVASKTLHKRLYERGLLVSVDEKRNTLSTRRTLEGARRQVLHLRSASVMPKESDQPDQTDLDSGQPCLGKGSPGQLEGHIPPDECEETDRENCPRDDRASTDVDEPDRLVSLVSSYSSQGGGQDQEALLAQRIEEATNAKGVPYEFAPGQRITDAAAFAGAEARAALSPNPAVSRPTRERLAAIGLIPDEAGFV